MTEFKPLVNDTYQTRILTDVELCKDGFEIQEGGLCFFLSNKNNSFKITPKIGDVALFYGKGLGYFVRGIQLNDKLVYYITPEEEERNHQKWVEETRKEHQKKYKILMDKIKDEIPFETVDVTGFGGGYERVCQLMIQAGIKFLNENEFHFDYYTYKGIYGVCVSDAPWSKKLEAVLMKACDNDCTGAMHQCVIEHLQYIYKQGYDSWLNKFPDKRRYVYPKELPSSSF